MCPLDLCCSVKSKHRFMGSLKQPMFPSWFGCCDMMPLRFNPPPNPWSEPSREFRSRALFRDEESTEKKKVRALRVSDDSDDRCFFSSFSSSDGSCLIVKKNYIHVSGLGQKLSTFDFWAAESHIFCSTESHMIPASERFLLEVFLRPLPGADLGGLQQLCRGRSIWPAMMLEILDSHWRRGE